MTSEAGVLIRRNPLHADKKLFVVFVLVSLVFFFIGTGGLSFKDAEIKANQTLAALGSEQVNELNAARSGFTESAIYWCIKSTNDAPTDFTIVMEMSADGNVKRLWREGNSRFAHCLRTVAEESFVFKPFFQPFFVSLKYLHES